VGHVVLQWHFALKNSKSAVIFSSNYYRWHRHNAANEYLGLTERAENGPPRACANWTAPSSGQ
jgi:hypothetical protein